MRPKTALVCFGEPPASSAGYSEVFAGPKLQELVEPGDIYQAAALLEELPQLTLSDGTPAAKAFVYHGFELWWVHYDSLFHHFCLPYTRYRALLEKLREFDEVHFSAAPHPHLFELYLDAHGVRSRMFGAREKALPLGVALQIFLSLIFLPALMVLRRKVMVYVGDKIEKGKDYDFRYAKVYAELRKRKVPFMECIRGVESWRAVLRHAAIRRRPVFYAETAVFLGRFLSTVAGGRAWSRKRFGKEALGEAEGEARFKLLLATRFLREVYADVWAIRIMRLVVAATGLRAALISVGSERNFPTLIACKLAGVPVVGLMHGVVSPHYMVSDFMRGFSGARPLAVDRYGAWSEWWRQKYLKESRLYTPEQIQVSGAMRPLEREPAPRVAQEGRVKTLFIAEQAAAPQEIAAYLEVLLEQQSIELTLKFRPYRDGFEQWLLKHRPDILARKALNVARGSMEEAVAGAEVVVGSHSTGVLEALLQLRVPIYFFTRKWGDYHELDTQETAAHFARTPEALIEKIQAARTVSESSLQELQRRYFGDSHQNGSAWAVGELERLSARERFE